MISLFQVHPKGPIVLARVTQGGKQVFTEHRDPTESDLEAHLKGEKALGVIPDRAVCLDLDHTPPDQLDDLLEVFKACRVPVYWGPGTTRGSRVWLFLDREGDYRELAKGLAALAETLDYSPVEGYPGGRKPIILPFFGYKNGHPRPLYGSEGKVSPDFTPKRVEPDRLERLVKAGELLRVALSRRPEGRHDTLLAFLNLAHRGGCLEEAQALFGHRVLWQAWDLPNDNPRSLEEWRDEVRRAAVAAASEDYEHRRGIPYLREQGYDLSKVSWLKEVGEPEHREGRALWRRIFYALKDEVSVWRGSDNTLWATIDSTHVPIDSVEFRDRLFHRAVDLGLPAPDEETLRKAADALRRYVSGERPSALRVAHHGGAVYVDLGPGRVVEVTPGGWRVVSEDAVPVAFYRPATQAPLPDPVPSGVGVLDELRSLFGFRPRDWNLFLGFLLACLGPGPYPILLLYGEKGSGKSTLARFVRGLLDPTPVPLLGAPKDEEGLMLAAKTHFIPTFDNLSNVRALSDGLCRLSTGGGLQKRRLYTDHDVVAFHAMRPVILTGIALNGAQDDLLDRSIHIELERLTRYYPEFWLNRKLADLMPRVLGVLLDGVATALRRQEEVLRRHHRLPRLADTALWVEAGGVALGLQPGEFLRALEEAQREASLTEVQTDPLAQAVLYLARDLHPGESRVFRTEQLLQELQRAAQSLGLDLGRLSLKGLGVRLVRLRQDLIRAGVEVTKEKERVGRRYTIRRLPPDDNPEGPGPSGGGGGPVTTWCRVDLNSSPTRHAENAVQDGAVTSVTSAPTVFLKKEKEEKVVGVEEGERESGETGEMSPSNSSHLAQPVQDAIFPAPSASAVTTRLVTATPDVRFRLVRDYGELEGVVAELGRQPILGLDLETTGLDPHRDRVRLITLATPEEAFLVDLFSLPQALEVLRPLLTGGKGPRLVGHNLKFDLGFLLKAGIEVEGGRLWDTALVHQVLNAEAKMPSLKELVPQLDKTLQTSDWSSHLSQEQQAYAALDALVLHDLFQEQREEVNQGKLGRVVAIEHRALPAIAWMELSGVPFDRLLWEEAVAELEGTMKSIQGTLSEEAELNWNSPQQVLQYLKRLGLDIPNTRAATLAQHRDRPLVAALLRYREAAKWLSTYGERWAGHIHPATGRIHPSWQQIGAATGRMACRKPNLQNIPRDPALRQAIRAPEGRVLVKADFSQIELRIAAIYAEEERMLQAFEEGQDLHTLTASLVLGKEPQEVTKEDRQLAKALNFGLLYGQGAKGLMEYALAGYGVKMTLEEAQSLREAFFRTYPDLRRWHLSQPEGEVEVRTLAGRRRVTDRFTEKLNTPVQGTGADGLKMALGLLWERRHQVGDTFPILAVHDEVVVEASAGRAQEAQEWLVQAMREGMARVVEGVPIEVEVGVYRDWGVTKEEP